MGRTGSGSTSASFWSAVAAAAQRNSIGLSAVGAAIGVVSAALLVLGGPLEDVVDKRQIVWGVVAAVLVGALAVLREWSQWWVDRGQREAAAQLRLAVKDALRPVAGMIAEMQTMTRAKREAHLQKVATQVVGSMQLLLSQVRGLRTVVYQLTGPDHLERIASLGREEEPAGNFDRHPQGEPDRAFDALENNESQLVHDVVREPPVGSIEHGTDHGYRTYMAVPIAVGDRGFGMLTLDAPDPDSFTDTDLKLCEFVAGMLAIAFACASRG